MKPETRLVILTDGTIKFQKYTVERAIGYWKNTAKSLFARYPKACYMTVVERGTAQTRYNPSPLEIMYAPSTPGSWGKSAFVRVGSEAK